MKQENNFIRKNGTDWYDQFFNIKRRVRFRDIIEPSVPDLLDDRLSGSQLVSLGKPVTPQKEDEKSE
jgi:hypothetical protein